MNDLGSRKKAAFGGLSTHPWHTNRHPWHICPSTHITLGSFVGISRHLWHTSLAHQYSKQAQTALGKGYGCHLINDLGSRKKAAFGDLSTHSWHISKHALGRGRDALPREPA